MTRTLRLASFTLLTASAVILTASAAWAPSPVATAVAAQRALGMSPCTPRVLPLPSELEATGIVGDADNGIQSGTCKVRLASSLPDHDVVGVAWHEVCHLSTVEAIAQSADKLDWGDDWAHNHPLFLQCNAGGY